MKNPLILIEDFSGGMTLNEKKGRSDQFHIGNILDFSSKPGYLAPGYGWTNMKFSDSANMPCEFNWILGTTKQQQIYLGGDDTKIYKKTDTGNIELAHDDANAGGIRGLTEYKSYLLWMGSTTMGTFDFGSTWTDSFKTGFTTAYWHPMFVSADGNCYIGHGKYIAKLTDPTVALSVGSVNLAIYFPCPI